MSDLTNCKVSRRRFLQTAAWFACCTGTPVWAAAAQHAYNPVTQREAQDAALKDYLFKMKNFDAAYPDDRFVAAQDCPLLASAVSRLKRIIRTVGYGNFALLDFDDAVKVAKRYTRVGPFSKEELCFLEKTFYTDSSVYGFQDDKPLKHLTDRIEKSKVIKIPHSGNYLYKGTPLETYRQIKGCIGENMILTSGLRSIIKQFYLFLKKAHANQGNLSLASRSLAPPGYSFHGVGDFDVGQVNFGEFNFTEKFTHSGVYKKLRDLGYCGFRYPRGNRLGVRFEPWHIKVSG